MPDLATLAGRHIVFFSWRDTRNPEGGGAERYLEKMAAGLVARGCRVTIFCAAHAAASPVEVVDGVRFVRRGSKTSVYPGNTGIIPAGIQDWVTIRGGCYVSDPEKLDAPVTACMREFVPASTKTTLLGFRLVRSGP